MKILQFVADSLGDGSYLVIGEGAAVAVDPQRDVRPFVAAAREHGVPIEFVFETHVHNDYISGGRELVALGAKVVAPEDSRLEFPHIALKDDETVNFGGVALRAMAAPGHTYEHTAYLAEDQNGALRGAFTGGALLMAAAGRTDLLGPEHTEELTRLQWETAQRLANVLPRTAEILPTHGAGSFCSSTGSADDRRAPLAVELGRNPALTTATAQAFRAIQLATKMPTPAYYQYMAPINRRGPRVYGEPPKPRLLSPDEVTAALREGIAVVDVRTRQNWATSHIPGTIEIEESGSMLAYLGWLIPFNAPLALIAYDQAQAERVTVDLFRIGYENVTGYLPWESWRAANRPVERLETVDRARAKEMLRDGEQVLDVRYTYEHEQLPLAGGTPYPIDELPEWLPRVKGRALVVCASGQRATMAASLLQREGLEVAAFIEGGAADLQ